MEPREREIVQRLVRFLRVDRASFEAARVRSQERFQRGELGPEGRLSPRLLYQRAVEAVIADGVVDDQEEQLLQGLRTLLDIPEELHHELLATTTPGPGEVLVSELEFPPGTARPCGGPGAISGDGAWLALGLERGGVRCCAFRGDDLQVFQAGAADATMVAVSADGSRVYSGDASGLVAAWNRPAGTLVGTLDVPIDPSVTSAGWPRQQPGLLPLPEADAVLIRRGTGAMVWFPPESRPRLTWSFLRENAFVAVGRSEVIVVGLRHRDPTWLSYPLHLDRPDHRTLVTPSEDLSISLLTAAPGGLVMAVVAPRADEAGEHRLLRLAAPEDDAWEELPCPARNLKTIRLTLDGRTLVATTAPLDRREPGELLWLRATSGQVLARTPLPVPGPGVWHVQLSDDGSHGLLAWRDRAFTVRVASGG